MKIQTFVLRLSSTKQLRNEIGNNNIERRAGIKRVFAIFRVTTNRSKKNRTNTKEKCFACS